MLLDGSGIDHSNSTTILLAHGRDAHQKPDHRSRRDLYRRFRSACSELTDIPVRRRWTKELAQSIPKATLRDSGDRRDGVELFDADEYCTRVEQHQLQRTGLEKMPASNVVRQRRKEDSSLPDGRYILRL